MPVEDINKHNTLLRAVTENDIEKMKTIFDSNDIDINMKIDSSDIDRRGYSALHVAVENENLDILRLLCKHPQIDINVTDLYGDTPLIMACASVTENTIDIVNILLQKESVDINIQNKEGRTALTYLLRS
eukprot:UN34712